MLKDTGGRLSVGWLRISFIRLALSRMVAFIYWVTSVTITANSSPPILAG